MTLAQKEASVSQKESAAAQPQPITAAPPSEQPSHNSAVDTTGSQQSKPAPVDMQAWKKRYRKYNTWDGAAGGLHLVDPLSGAEGSVRIQVGVQGFGTHDFLVTGDDVESMYESISVSWTPIEQLELYGSLISGSTAVKLSNYETKIEDPHLENTFHITGQALLGLKTGAFVTPILSVGGDASILMPNQPEHVGVELDAMSVCLRGDMAVDLRFLDNPVPFIGRFNMDYRFDNSAQLVADTEHKRYENLYAGVSNPPSEKLDIEHFITRVERFGLGVNRVDLFSLGLGIELPLRVAEEFYLQPMMEWRMSFPVDRQDFSCPYRDTKKKSVTTANESPYVDDGCGFKEGADAYPSTLSFAVRGITPIRGVSAILGIDVGLTGTSTFARELKPTAPYEIIFAAAYDYDARPLDVRIVERKVAVEQPPKGRVRGLVTQSDAPTKAIKGAMITFVGTELSPLSTEVEGRFTSYVFDPGKIEMAVRHADYKPGACYAEIPANGGDIDVTCPLEPLPRVGEFKGNVIDLWNNSVSGATVEIIGATNRIVITDEEGRFSAQIEPGEYSVRIDAAGYLLRLGSFTLPARGTVLREFVLAKKPEKSAVSLTGDTIAIKTPLTFDKNTGKLDSKSTPVVAQIADLILRSPQIRKIKIFGSTSGAKGDSMAPLTRALNIKYSLVNAGVAAERIEAVAGDQPKVKITVEPR
jgi:OmpA-OmpF porin, OOP family